MEFVSYAQNFEDVMLWRALRGVEKGFYVDIGAHSPDIWSVTRLFYENGWHGINVEPNPSALAGLKARRPHDINLGLAISDETGEVAFHQIEETGLSTLDPQVARQAVALGRIDTVLSVPVTTLADLFEQYVPPDQPVHFLKIDVEGLEERVIHGGDWDRHRPWIVVAEATVPLSPERSHSRWEPRLISAGYDFVWFDGLNRYYVASEHADLKAAFDAPPNIFDGFRRAEEVEFEHRSMVAEAQLARDRAVVGKVEALIAAQTRHFDTELVPFRKMMKTLEWMQEPIWIRLLFKRSGKPRKALRRALFHTSGKPRGVFRSLVLRPNGRPHAPFRKWMASPEYLSLRSAVRPIYGMSFDDLGDDIPDARQVLSSDAQVALRRILALRAPSRKGS